jgi:plasmid stabilization system protein ParE
LRHLRRYIVEQAGEGRAAAYFEKFERYLELLRLAPLRGERVDDIRPGLRITNFQRTLILAFHMTDQRIVIDRCFYKGRNWRAVLKTRPRGA